MGHLWQLDSMPLSFPLSPQVVLGQNGSILLPFATIQTITPPKDVLTDSLIVPAYVAGASVVVLLLHLLLKSQPVKRLYIKMTGSRDGSPDSDAVETEVSVPGEAEFSSRFVRHIARQGGLVVFTFNLVRFLSCLSLLVMSGVTVYSSLKEEGGSESVAPVWLHAALTGTYAYASLLAFVSVLVKPASSITVIRHLVSVLFTTWVVYVYRDVWPFATFTLSPMDASEGALLWVRFAILTLCGVVVPLFVPRPYVPFDPKHPSPEPHPEQTASIISLALFSWLDATVLKAYRVPHLPLEQLPPLADYDDAENLVKTSYPEIDPFKVKTGRHIGWGLFKHFRYEFLGMGMMIVLHTLALFSNPVGMKNLLAYMEDSESALVRPWLWISWLFIGPMVSVICVSAYFFISTRILVRMEALLTQLVFDHALRMRVKAEVSDAAPSTASTTAAGTPDTASIAESSTTRDAQESPDASGDESTLAASSATDASSAKGKQKSKGSAAPESGDGKKDISKKAAPEGGPKEKGKNMIGKINNLITTDLETLSMGREILQLVIEVPVQLGLCIWFLYAVLGWSAFVGLAVIVLLLPLPGYLAKMLRGVQVEKMKKTDGRVQSVTEAMNVIRMIKMFGWEPRITHQLTDKREDELIMVQKSKLLQVINGNLNNIIPLLTMIATFLTYTIIMKQQLSASKVFSSMTVFELFSMQMHMIFGMIPAFIRAKVSLDRLNDFLHKTELLDEYSEKSPDTQLVLPEIAVPSDVIGIRNAAFTWANESDVPSTPGTSRRKFTLRIEEELTFKHGCVNLIIGPTGSGKTSVLMALLGEMHYIPSSPDSYFNLPRSGGVAYAAQESWVQNETIRDNIIFGAPYDEERYNQVIEQCGLKRDLELFDAGDMTEVGEKGITLSGGQKARVTLARAVYSTAEILLLDDVLAALDVHTARWIIEKCLKGNLVRGRTVLLVTHNVAMASPIAEFVVAMGTDGRVSSQGSLSTALEKDQKLAEGVAGEQEALQKAAAEVDPGQPSQSEQDATRKSDGKLVVSEEIAEGHLGWAALKLYFANLAGKHRIIFWIGLLTLNIISESTDNLQVWYLGYWARQYEERAPEDVDVPFYLAMYGVIMVASVVFYCIYSVYWIIATLRASRAIHRSLISSVLGTTLRWLDKTPTARVIARCTQDIDAIDGRIPMTLGFLMTLTANMLLKLAAVVITSPLFLIPGILIALAGGWLGRIYMQAQLAVKREKSNARAPVLGHVGAAFAGLVSIRAYSAQEAFRRESYVRINRYTRSANIFWNLTRWVCIRIEAFGALFSAGLAAYLVYGTDTHASTTGFSLNMAIGFSNMILWWVRMFNEFEVAGNSLERIQQYLEIEQEPKSTESGNPPAYWPASGHLKVEKLSARYSPDGPKVLHDISFEVKSGERIGIVGRTGSGKSSLTLALLRAIITEGKVYYDGLPTDGINLDALRSHITIIPQAPELLSGTLRQNLDLFEEYDDAVLNDALRSAGLFSLQKDMDEGQITLDTEIASGGSNLSVGQKQILALARAIVRQSKLLILDEATSAIDYATDTVIQASLRKELDKGVTLLTVAHRLQTIMDADKIMVLDAGDVVEFGKPSELLKNENGRLRSLVDESGDKDNLYAMAAGSGLSA